jgi:hypothetical protein
MPISEEQITNLTKDVENLKRGRVVEKVILPVVLLTVGSLFTGCNHQAQLKEL